MPPRMRVALATAAAFSDLSPDDQLLIEPLRRLGIDAVPTVWSDASVDWQSFAGVVVRSCWDYHTRHDEFLAWVGRLELLGIPMLNPAPMVRWNSDKKYMLDLARRGVRIVPTVVVQRGTAASLGEMLASKCWPRAVIKPAISASAHDTWVASPEDATGLQPRLETMLRRGDVLVQPFVNEIAGAGEWSLVFLGGTFSHAVLKRPAAGDFRVQSEHGGSAERREPTVSVVKTAASILRTIPLEHHVLYARVDGYVDANGEFVLMELELIEPLLYLAEEATAAGRLANAIAADVRPHG